MLYAIPGEPPAANRLSGHKSRTSNTNGTPNVFATRRAASAANSCGDEPITMPGADIFRPAIVTARENNSQFHARRQSFFR